MFLIIRNNAIVAECKTRIQVINWYKEFKHNDCYIIKGSNIKEFIKKAVWCVKIGRASCRERV